VSETDPLTIPIAERMPRRPLVLNNRSMAWISDRIAGIVENKAPLWWWVAIAITGSFTAFGTFCILYLLFTGVGVWGNNIPVGWAWGITNFVFWIGIGHAGTLISAILHLSSDGGDVRGEECASASRSSQSFADSSLIGRSYSGALPGICGQPRCIFV
jgi:hypothetical protein